MKKTLFLIASVLLFATAPANAQGWKDALKKAATTAADKATDGKLTQYALVGEWHYSGPGIKFEGGDVASELGGAAIETSLSGQLEKAYLLAGIKPGACTFSFDKENAFTAAMGTHTLSGTYEFDASAHLLTLHFAKGKFNLGSMPGHVYISGEQLQMVFPVTKVVDMVTALSSKVSSLESAAALLKKYKNVYIGFEFGK